MQRRREPQGHTDKPALTHLSNKWSSPASQVGRGETVAVANRRESQAHEDGKLRLGRRQSSIARCLPGLRGRPGVDGFLGASACPGEGHRAALDSEFELQASLWPAREPGWGWLSPRPMPGDPEDKDSWAQAAGCKARPGRWLRGLSKLLSLGILIRQALEGGREGGPAPQSNVGCRGEPHSGATLCPLPWSPDSRGAWESCRGQEAGPGQGARSLWGGDAPSARA